MTVIWPAVERRWAVDGMHARECISLEKEYSNLPHVY
jgi:hypothetical protein